MTTLLNERELVIEAVLDGSLPAEYITDQELSDLEEVVFDLICYDLTPFEVWETVQ